MKKLSTYLFLLLFTLQAPSWADDIQDFEIEGISIGDSALDYFTEQEIFNSIQSDQYPSSDKYYIVQLHTIKSLEVYEGLNISIKKDDKKYIIAHIQASTFYNDEDFKNCFKQKANIEEELSVTLENFEIVKRDFISNYDKSGLSKHYATQYYIGEIPVVAVKCMDWSEKVSLEKTLSVSIYSEEFAKWLLNEAHK